MIWINRVSCCQDIIWRSEKERKWHFSCPCSRQRMSSRATGSAVPSRVSLPVIPHTQGWMWCLLTGIPLIQYNLYVEQTAPAAVECACVRENCAIHFYGFLGFNRPLPAAAFFRTSDWRCRCTGVVLCVFSSHSFWTSSSLDLAGVTQEEGHTGFFIHLLSAVRALIFLAIRIQAILSLVDREVEFCVLTI